MRVFTPHSARYSHASHLLAFQARWRPVDSAAVRGFLTRRQSNLADDAVGRVLHERAFDGTLVFPRERLRSRDRSNGLWLQTPVFGGVPVNTIDGTGVSRSSTLWTIPRQSLPLTSRSRSVGETSSNQASSSFACSIFERNRPGETASERPVRSTSASESYSNASCRRRGDSEPPRGQAPRHSACSACRVFAGSTPRFRAR